MRFVCPDGDPQHRPLFAAAAASLLQPDGHEWQWYDGTPVGADEWARRLEGADGALFGTELPADVFVRSPSLRVLSFAGTGAARFVDLDEAARRDVTVCNVPSYGAAGIAEHALALMLAVAHSVPAGDRDVREGRWRQPEHFQLAGKTLGVVGAGSVGCRVAQLGSAVGMTPLAWTRRPTPARAAEMDAPFVTLEELFARSDVVSVHVAHTSDTEKLVSRALLELLKPSAILINTARAEVVDNEALVELLDRDAIRGAGIDVFDQEPPDPSDPLLLSARTVLSAHSAFNTPEAVQELARVAVTNFATFARGDPQNLVGGG